MSRTLTAVDAQHFAILPLAIALGSADIGRAKLDDGREVYITWGRNLSERDADLLLARTTLSVVEMPGTDGLEVMLPDDEIERILPLCWSPQNV